MLSNGRLGYIFKGFLMLICISGVVAVALAQTEKKDQSATYEKKTVRNPMDIDEIVIDNRGYKRDRMGPVKFSHKKHAADYKVNCWDCHHDYKDGKNVWAPWVPEQVQKCKDCHDPVKVKDKAMKLQRSYHINCKICHKERDIFKGEPRAYRKCVKCHIKKETVKS